MGGSAPRSEPVQIQPAVPAPGYDFSEAFFEQVLPELVNAPFPRYEGNVDPGLSPTMAALLRGSQTFTASPFSEGFNQAGSTLGKFMNTNYEDPLASQDPNRYGFDYAPRDFRSLAQSPAPGMPPSMRAAAESMAGPWGQRAGGQSRPVDRPLPPNTQPSPGGPNPPGGAPGVPPRPEQPEVPGGPILNPREPEIELNFGGVRPYRPISGGQGFLDYNPGSEILRMVAGLRAGSATGGNPMPPGPIGGPPPPAGGGPPSSSISGQPGGGSPGSGTSFDPNGRVPGNMLTWMGRHHGVNKGKSMDEIYRDNYERGWDYGPSFQKPAHWGERGSKPTTWGEVMQMPAHRRAPGSPGAAGDLGGDMAGTTDPRRITAAAFGPSGAPAGGK